MSEQETDTRPPLPEEIERRMHGIEQGIRGATACHESPCHDWHLHGEAAHEALDALVRDAVAAKDARIAELTECCTALERERDESQADRDATRRERDECKVANENLRAMNVALGKEKELALAEAYRENERLRTELDEARSQMQDDARCLAETGRAANLLSADLRTAREGIEETTDYIRNGTYNVVRNAIERLTDLLAEIGE